MPSLINTDRLGFIAAMNFEKTDVQFNLKMSHFLRFFYFCYRLTRIYRTVSPMLAGEYKTFSVVKTKTLFSLDETFALCYKTHVLDIDGFAVVCRRILFSRWFTQGRALAVHLGKIVGCDSRTHTHTQMSMSHV